LLLIGLWLYLCSTVAVRLRGGGEIGCADKKLGHAIFIRFFSYLCSETLMDSAYCCLAVPETVAAQLIASSR
jgi:hypothetical protein